MCGRRRPKNQFFWLSFFLLIAALVLAIIALAEDKITQVNFSLANQHSTYYCGFQEFHSSNKDFFDQNSENDRTYSQNCDNNYGHSFCHMEKVGYTWLALLCIGIFFGLVGVAGFILDLCITCHLFAMGGTVLFGLCMIASIIQWCVEERCSTTCEDTTIISSVCHSEWGLSLILATVSGAVAILSCVTYSWWD